jgi:hypothetical protein
LAALLPVGSVELYAPLEEKDVEHNDDCTRHDACGFTSRVFSGPFTAEEWTALKFAKEAIRPLLLKHGDQLHVEVRRHEAWCENRHCETAVYRYGLRLMLDWHGMELQRELAIW